MDTLRLATWRIPAHTATQLEQATLDQARRADLGSVREALGGPGLVYLATCQRVAWFLEGDEETSHVDRLLAWYRAQGRTVPAPELHHGFEAFRQLATIASSLDSLVPGEPQVLGQVKEALRQADTQRTLTPTLRHVFDHALRVAKAVRSSSTLFRGRVSLLPLVEETLRPVLAAKGPCRIAVVGTGEMAGRIRRMLRRVRRDVELHVVSRDAARAQAVAGAVGATGTSLEAFLAAPPPVAAVVSSVEADAPIIPAGSLAAFPRPLVVVDVAMPRNVETPAQPLPGLRLVQLDELAALRSAGVRHREQAYEEAQRILEDELDVVRHAFDLRCKASGLRTLAERFESVAAERWRRASIDRTDPRLQKWYDQTVRALLHEATAALKQKGAP